MSTGTGVDSVNEKVIKAIELQNLGLIEQAIPLFQEVLSVDPGNAAANYSLALILFNLGQLDVAAQICDRGCELASGFAPLHFLRGSIRQAQGDHDGALASYDAALSIQPDFKEVLINSGALLRTLLRHGEALERFNRVLAIDPSHTSALANCAIILTEFKQSEQAIAMFERLLDIAPDFDYGPGLLIYERLHAGLWRDFEVLLQRIQAGVKAGKRVCKSLAFMALSDEASEHYLCARIFAHRYCPKPAAPLWRGEDYRHQRLRVAYISPDLREHPVGHLMAGVFEHHDKTRFETIAISLGIDDQSRLRERMTRAFDHFIDARAMGARQIAEVMRQMEVDVAVDLAGYTSDARVEIYAHRPAPVHASFLGYPGTLGVPYMDFIVADRHVIPPEHQPFYTESVAYLPDTYLPTDASIVIADPPPSRAECGLPESGAVFCSFSHDYKISPPLWAVWMRILRAVPGSVLWLVSRQASTQANFRREAEQAGVDPDRLVFASRVPRVEDHLARYRLADLFLDTWPYNAHTTAADALMAGLPVITRMGNAFPARVAGSLLHAAGLPELIAESWEAYEALAVSLVTDRAQLSAIKAKLALNRANSALFDTARFTRNLENVYVQMLKERLAIS